MCVSLKLALHNRVRLPTMTPSPPPTNKKTTPNNNNKQSNKPIKQTNKQTNKNNNKQTNSYKILPTNMKLFEGGGVEYILKTNRGRIQMLFSKLTIAESELRDL